MRTLYVVTHPEASHHIDRLVGGWYDSRLTSEGLRAAQSIGRALRAELPGGADVELYASDLRRTAETADAIAEHLGVRPVLDPRWREMSFGEAEGRPQEEWDGMFTAPPQDNQLDHAVVPGAETRRAVAERIGAAVGELLRRPAEHQVVVTHGYALTFVVATWIGMPIESMGRVVFKARSGSITTLHEDDLYRGRLVMSLGDTRHLDS